MNASSKKKIIVAGGGISGLSTAFWLIKMGYSVSLLEKESTPGGYVQSEYDSGYLIESGPNSLMDQYPEVRELCSDLGLNDERIEGNSDSKKRYLVKNGRLCSVPLGLGAFIASSLWSVSGKARILGEPFVKKSSGQEESVASFFERRIGKELVEYGLDPFVSGIYAGDPSLLCVQSTFPRAFALEQNYGSLLKGIFLKGFREKKKYRGKLFSFRKGLGRLTQGLWEHLKESIKTGWEVKGLQGSMTSFPRVSVKGKWRDQDVVEEGDALIMAIPSYVSSSMIVSHSHPLSELLKEIPYAPLVVVYLGFDQSSVEHPMDGFGCLIPHCEGFELLGSLWNSTLFSDRAPEGCVSMTNFLGGTRKSYVLDYSDERLIAVVLKELRTLMGIKASPRFTKVVRYPKAIPQYHLGHQDKLRRMASFLKDFPWLYLTGNYLRGVSVPDCIQQSAQTARQVDSYFTAGTKVH